MEQTEKRGFFRRLIRVLAIVLAGILLAALVLTVIPMTETVSPKTVEGSVDWMKELDGNLRLNEIVLPGSHDSAAQYVQLAFVTKCQGLSIGEQLEAGVRYLDIRLGLTQTDGEKTPRMQLMHGFTKCRTGAMPWSETLYLDAVLEQCFAFLKAHPSETVVFAVKYEHGSETARAFAQRLEAAISENPEFWYTENRLPTLEEARGKLVLMRRYLDRSLPEDAVCAGVPLFWHEQNGHDDVSRHIEMTDNGGYRLWVQDRYEYGNEDKWTAFLAGLDCEEIGPDDVSIHFLSTKGTAAYGHPYGHAKALNQRFIELPAERLRGWIILDFVDADLCRHVWSVNFGE
ncbi:MAG: phosphatidylinositol-specific phospholipase C domain-containing protein [Oscillospiraceae bacterium]|nr:phosphatidylinositol-specific phospholipase C domain-containing protein [Oscillospiraceae bacterium]